MTWLDWTKLESNLPLDELPSLQRSVLKRLQPDEDWDSAFLRKVQSRFQAALKQLERDGRVKVEADRVLIDADLLPEVFRHLAS
jgi:hypothetical protein